MSAKVATSSTNDSTIIQIDVNMLIKENEILRAANEKLYRRTLNQRRKLLRLKRKLSDESPEPAKISDTVWEDVEEVLASYNIEN